MISEPRFKQLSEFTSQLGISISNYELLNKALTHGSYIKEKKLSDIDDNERLEFFGDAVLKMYVSEYLMDKYPDFPEGKLSKLRAYVVSEKVLAQVANEIGLRKYILLGKNEKKAMPISIEADTIESLLAVIYYLCGSDKARDFVLRFWKKIIDDVSYDVEKGNYKAMLQEYTQANKLGLPEYVTISEIGPDHNKIFEVSVLLGKNELGSGKAKTKKEASQLAAKSALKYLQKRR